MERNMSKKGHDLTLPFSLHVFPLCWPPNHSDPGIFIVLFFSILPQINGKLFSWLCIILLMEVFLLLISFNIQYWHFLHKCVQFSQETYFIYIYAETCEYLFSNMYNFSFLSIYPFLFDKFYLYSVIARIERCLCMELCLKENEYISNLLCATPHW